MAAEMPVNGMGVAALMLGELLLATNNVITVFRSVRMRHNQQLQDSPWLCLLVICSLCTF